MTSVLTLYPSSGLKPERNQLVEHILTYLNGIEDKVVISDFQYIKHDLKINIKVDMPQESLDGARMDGVDYVSIRNHTATSFEMIYYYFVTNKRWTSENTILLELEQDVLNTWNTLYTLTDKTKVYREHKDRLVKKQYTGGTYLTRKIDNTSEDITVDLTHDDNDDVKIVDPFDTSWNLVYKNREEPDPDNPTPVDLYAFPDVAAVLRVHGGISHITAEDLTGSTYFYFLDGQYQAYAKRVDGVREESLGEVSVLRTGSWVYHRWMVVQPHDDVLHAIMYYVFGGPGGGGTATTLDMDNIEYLSLASNDDVRYHYSDTFTKQPEVSATYPTRTLGAGGYTDVQVTSIDNVDRTDSKIIKIIKIPYFPAPVRVLPDVDKVSINAPQWVYDGGENGTGGLKYQNLETPLNRSVDVRTQVNPFDPLIVSHQDIPYEDKTALRDDYRESKLFHSDFYLPKFVYDSFGLGFELNNVDVDSYIRDQGFYIDYTVTRTMNSRFLFKFPQYKCTKASQDYNNVVSVNRNNEVPIYNSEYLNYVRNGYNYDKKNRNLGIVNTVTSIAKGVVGGLISGNPAGVAVGVVAGTIAGITSSIQSNNAIEQKLQQTQNQAVSVSGSDDIDLLDSYSDNRAKVVTYQASPEVKQMLGNLFYYYGYKCSKYGTPDTTSRYWFNFIQCDPDITTDRNMDDRYVEQLKNKYRDGVTVFHHHLMSGANTWDFNQTHENWEVSLDE